MNRSRYAGIALLLALLSAIGLGAGTRLQASESPTHPQPRTFMKIHIDMAGTTLTATLEDNAAARDFAAMLPLELTLTDYASTEKISDLPKALSTQGSPSGMTPRAGDLTYYAPWGNLAIFYKGFQHASGLVRLGRLEGGVELMQRAGPIKATFRAAP